MSGKEELKMRRMACPAIRVEGEGSESILIPTLYLVYDALLLPPQSQLQ